MKMSAPDNVEKKRLTESEESILGFKKEETDLMRSTENLQVETIINELTYLINAADFWKKKDLVNYICSWKLWSKEDKELEKMVQYMIYWSYEHINMNEKPQARKLKYILDSYWKNKDINKILKEIQNEERRIKAISASRPKEQRKKEWVLEWIIEWAKTWLSDLCNYWQEKLSNLWDLIVRNVPSGIINWIKNNLFSNKEKQRNTENIHEIYNKLQWKEKPDFFPFYLAMQWYNKQKNIIWNSKYLTVVDYSRPVNQNRLYVLNMQTLTVENCVPTWHGKNSGDQKTTFKFSNNNNSNQTCIGFFRTPQNLRSNSKWTRKGLFLTWQDRFFNDNAEKRWIAMHGVKNFFYARTEKGHRAWESTSEGCITIRYSDNPNEIMNKIKGGSLIYSYFPDMEYLNKSSWIA